MPEQTIIHEVEQGSSDWWAVKAGIPSASNFDKIITPKTLKFSSSAEGYAHRLLAEELLRAPVDDASSSFMERGQVLERAAVDYYEFERGVESEAVGFILRDDRRVGGSPDRLVGANGGLEIKCPSAAVHVGYLLDEQGIGYRAQVQGLLYLAEREWWDTLSYHPDLPPALVRQTRNEAFITALVEALDRFNAMKDEMKAKLQGLGLFAGEEIPGVFPIDGVRRCSMCKREAARPASLLCDTCAAEHNIQLLADSQ